MLSADGAADGLVEVSVGVGGTDVVVGASVGGTGVGVSVGGTGVAVGGTGEGVTLGTGVGVEPQAIAIRLTIITAARQLECFPFIQFPPSDCGHGFELRSR